MRYLALLTITMGLLFAGPSRAVAKVNVFACAPEWAALSEEIGGEHVKVYTASTAHQDVHHMRAKPSLLSAMRKADLVFCSGAALEIGWLPILIQKAGGPDVQYNAKGWLMGADFVEKLGVMQKADRSMGHVHPQGNPHVHMDPHNIVDIADILAERLFLIDPENAAAYEANLSTFKARWGGLITAWEASGADLRGKNVVVYHRSWAYLTKWLGLNIIAALEPKPGLPPTTAHLEDVLQSLKGKETLGILVAPFENDKAAKWLSERTDIPVLYLPYTVGGTERAKDLESFFDDNISMLKGAM